KKRKRKRILLWVLVAFVAILVAVRLYLPTIVLRYVNKEINTIPGYQGHVDNISMSLWRGAYQINGIELNKVNGQVPVPFFSSQTIDLSLEWAALFHGAIVAKIKFLDPTINFVNGPTAASSQSGMDSSWIQVVRNLMPLDINRVDIVNGEVHYRDFTSTPKIDIFLSNINAAATNLRNKVDKDKALPSTITVSATCFKTGNLSLDVALDPLNEVPTFELKEKMKGVQLTELNDFTEAYLKFKIIGGTMELYTEVAAANGAFDGYTKPLFHDIKVETNIKENKNIWHWLIANGTQFVTNIFSNHSHNQQFATRIPIHGTFKSPKPDSWAAIGGILKNAFVQALTPTLDSTLHISDIDRGNETDDK
ncbi:MAG TPA: DUF748 domain-containing protein, partial [Bacteroidia bacterium]|nr:DUF748 domain-containing protein [Bacteroidia bacterium]